MSENLLSSVASLMAVLGGIGAGIAFIVSFRQYKKGQNWLRAQIVISLIDAFEKDEQIELACTMLDWDEREIVLPGGKSLRFSNDMLVSALRVPEMDICSANRKNASEEKLLSLKKKVRLEMHLIASLISFINFTHWKKLSFFHSQIMCTSTIGWSWCGILDATKKMSESKPLYSTT